MLVSRFWYIRSVNPVNLTVTGLTRDGTWLVEKGKIVHPVNNFRFNDSPVNVLKNLEATTSSSAPEGVNTFPWSSPQSVPTISCSRPRATRFEAAAGRSVRRKRGRR